MRLFVFVLSLILIASVSQAQQLPELGPEADTPSLDDLGSLPETEQDEESGKTVAGGKVDDETVMNDLFEELAASEGAAVAASIAQKIQSKWLESGSDTVNVLMSRSTKALRADNHGLALDLLDVVVTLKPEFAEGWNRRATVFYMQKEYGRSLVDIERTLALEPRHWGALSGLGIIQKRLGKDKAAMETFRRALEIHPGLENARQALDALEKAAEGDPA